MYVDSLRLWRWRWRGIIEPRGRNENPTDYLSPSLDILSLVRGTIHDHPTIVTTVTVAEALSAVNNLR